MLHSRNCRHSISQFKVLQAQAQKIKEQYNSQSPESKRNFKAKQKLNVLVAKAVKKAIGKQDKKKKCKIKKTLCLSLSG